MKYTNQSQNYLMLLIMAILVAACSSKFRKSPVDLIIRDMPQDEVFSIILNDMDVQGNFSKSYYHRYKVISQTDPDNINETTTEWYEVSKQEFNKYINDMGMEIAARDSTGNLTKSVAPPGYNNYVGNRRYGYWENRGGHSFWAFYGQYAFMSSMFNMATYPVRRSYYSDWRGSYYGTDRRYYGPTVGGGTYYGTRSSYNRTNNPSSAWNSKSSSFRDKVRGRTSRSGSRSSSSSSHRSRGGSSGK